jgi:rare lipoprotein A
MRNAVLLLGLVMIAVAPAAQARPHAELRHHHHRHHHAHHLDRSRRPQVGRASYYGTHEAGRTTASGKPLKPGRLTAASKTLPLGARAKVVNMKTGKSVRVTVTDRGPYAKGRILDVSPRAAKALGMKHDGVAQVKVTPLKEPTSR